MNFTQLTTATKSILQSASVVVKTARFVVMAELIDATIALKVMVSRISMDQQRITSAQSVPIIACHVHTTHQNVDNVYLALE